MLLDRIPNSNLTSERITRCEKGLGSGASSGEFDLAPKLFELSDGIAD